MPIYKEVESYTLMLNANGEGWLARVHLACADGYGLDVFFDDGRHMPPNSWIEEITRGKAFESFERFQAWVDLVRNERPLTVSFNLTHVAKPNFLLFTGSEPPGEEES